MNDNELITAPVTPSEGAADPQTELVPATSAAEIISQETSQDSCELGSIEPSLTDAEKKDALSEFQTLDAEVYSKADALAGEYQALMDRFNDELLPLCDRVQTFLSQRGSMHIPGLPSWTSWRDAFLKSLQKKMKMSLSTLKRRLKELRQLDEPDAPDADADNDEGQEEQEDTSTPAEVCESPKEQVTKWMERARKVLSGGDGPMDANPMRDGERRIGTALQLLDEFQLALDEGLLDPTPQVAWLHSEINKHQQSKLTVVPLHLREANALVAKLHRHHKPIRVAKFSIGASISGKLVAAAISMRPASRHLDDGRTIEVCRMASVLPDDDPDARNACSFLYGACARIAREMGFLKITTYILQDEPGMTLRGAGWTLEKTNCGGSKQGFRKNRPNGHEVSEITFTKKQRWAKLLQPQADKKAASSVTPTEVNQRKPVVALRVLPSPSPCGGCKDMHWGIAEMAKANPGISDEELVEKSGCDLVIVRQAKVRHLDWKKETA